MIRTGKASLLGVFGETVKTIHDLISIKDIFNSYREKIIINQMTNILFQMPHMIQLFVPTIIMISSYFRVCVEARRSTNRVKRQWYVV